MIALISYSLSKTTSKAAENNRLIALIRPHLVVPWPECMVGHPCHNYGLITRFEVCNALRIWGYALCDSRNA